MNKYIKHLILILFAWNLVSCQSYIEGFEEDPNNPDDAPADKMLQGVILADMFTHSSDLNRLTGMWMGYFTGMDRQYVALDTWDGSQAADFDNTWGNLYSGVITQSRIAQEKATVGNALKLRGVLKVLEAHALGTVTQLWGDVPNTEVNNVKEFPNPAYDDQLAVYAYLQTLLTGAIADLNAGVDNLDNIAVEDIFFGTNAINPKDAGTSGVLMRDAWIKFAHSLKARYFLHTKSYASAETEAALGIMSVSDEVWAPFGETYGASFNPFYSFLIYDRAGYMGADLAHAAELLDPYDLSGSGKYRGNSYTDEEARFTYNYLPYFEYYTAGYEPNYFNDFDWGTANGKFGKEFPMFTAGESMLIIAECRARQADFNGALTAYNNYRNYLSTGGGGFWNYVSEWGLGVEYSAYPAFEFSPGGVVNHGQPDQLSAIIYEIIEERYVSMAGELESFNDWRRTDNLIGVPIKNGGTQIPMRLLYSQVEVNSNKSTPSPIPDFYEPTDVHQ